MVPEIEQYTDIFKVAGATLGMSEDDFFKWLTRKGLSEKDSNTMKGIIIA